MKRTKTKLGLGALMALLLCPGHPMASDTGAVPPAPSVYHEVSFTLGLALDAKSISLNGILSYGGGSGRVGATRVRTQSFEIASAPNLFTRIRQGVAAARMIGRATERVVVHCWRELLEVNQANKITER